MRDQRPGTVAARRILLAAGFGVPVLGLLRLWASHAGLFSNEVGTGLLVIAFLAVVAAVAVTTARRLNRVAAELEDERARLESVLSAATGYAIVALDLDGAITLVNRGAELLLGYRSDELVGSGQRLELIDGAEIVARAAELGIEPGLEVFFAGVHPDVSDTRDWTMLAKDGRRVPVSVTLSAMVVDGRATGYTAIARDISDEHRILAELRRSTAQLGEIVRLSPLPLLISRIADGRILAVNKVWLEIFGFKDEAEVIGHNSIELGLYPNPDDRVPIAGALARGEQVSANQVDLCTRGGRLMQMQVSAQRIELDGEDCILGVLVDLTERLRTERELARLASENALLLEAAADGIIALGLDGAITYVNSRVTTLLQWPSRELVGAPMYKLLHHTLPDGTPRPRGKSPIRAVLNNGGRARVEDDVFWRRDGTSLPVAYTVASINNGSGADGAVVYFRDITEPKRWARELEAAREQALDASRMKSEFLATMSHEIRTPMNAVIGMTGLLLRTGLDDQQREYAEHVRSSGEALLALIKDILDFSKIEAGRVELERAPFDLRVAVEDTADLVASGAHAKDLELAISLDADVPARVIGDANLLRQVLLNLLSNAVKFTARGEIVVSGRSEPDLHPDGRTIVRFEVSDTGIGVDPDAQDRLFESFTQADASTTRRYGGTGLGLAISRRLVELMGGTLGLTSVPGVGSRFWFRIPFDVAPVRPGAGPADMRGGGLRGLRVLAVDDNATARRVLCDRLRSWHLETDDAPGGQAALDLLRAAAAEDRPYALVVTDLGMPGFDGMQLAHAIAADPRISVPVVALSAHGAEDVAAARSSGLEINVVSKPAHSSRLFETVAAALGMTGPTAAPKAAADAADGQDAGGGERVLVVDDNAVNQRVATLMLENAGYVVDAVADGQEALRALAGLPYDAVLMDLEMPVMDGWSAIRAIRRGESGTATIPVIALSAAALPEDRRRALEAGADLHVSKPIRTDELERALYEVLRSQRAAVASATAVEDAAAGAGGINDVGAVAVAGPGGEDDVLDLERRAELRGLDGTGEALDDLTDRFFAGSEVRIAELERLARAADGEGMRRLAHEVRGSAANLGLRALAARCRELESAVSAAGVGAGIDAAGIVRLAGDIRAAEQDARGVVSRIRA
jgi:PAS domain S-box-containing protein